MVFVETPEETCAFLARAKEPTASMASSHTTTPLTAMSTSSRAMVQNLSSIITFTLIEYLLSFQDSAPERQDAAPDKRKALSQLVRAHEVPPSAASAVLIASSFSSLAPSKSISQSGLAAASSESAASKSKVKALSCAGPKKTSKASTSSLFVPSSVPSSRDTSPLPEQLAGNKLAEYGGDLDIDPTTILNDIPALLAPVIQMPNPLPGPLYIPERLVPLPPVDWDNLLAAERTKLKAKRQLKVKDLKPMDQTVVSSAISQMGALLMAVCGFPDADMAWLLACKANDWASRRHGCHLKLTKGSEYLQLVSETLVLG
jgi:hypothetical protein